jgi:hypothetical protein
MEGIDQTRFPQHEWAPCDPVDPARRVRRHAEEPDRSHADRTYRFERPLDAVIASGCGRRAEAEVASGEVG